MEGLLDLVAQGGISDSQYWRLTKKALESFAKDDKVRATPLQTIKLSEIKDVTLESGALSLTVGDATVKLQTAISNDLVAWKKAIDGAKKKKKVVKKEASGAAASAASASSEEVAGDEGDESLSGISSRPAAPGAPAASAASAAPTAPAARAAPAAPDAPAASSPRSSPRNADMAPTQSARKSPAKSPEQAQAEIEAAELLEKIHAFTTKEGLRVGDLFRSSKYNPSYHTTRDEELDAEELATVMQNAGTPSSAKACASLISLINGETSGKKTLGIKDLSDALRHHKWGKEVWTIRDEQGPQQAKKSMKDWKRKEMTAEERSGPQWAAPTLEAISRLLDTTRLRLTDLFRHPTYNPSYLQTGDESLDARELHALLTRAGLEVSYQDIKNMVDCLDVDGSGSIESRELEGAMRKYRQGNMVWTIPKAKKKMVLNLEHLHGLHRLHAEKLEKVKSKQDLGAEAEKARIETEVKEARLGTRATVDPKKEYNGDECRDRLHNHFKDEQVKKMELVKKAEMEDQQKLDSARLRPVRSASEPAVAREIAERNGNFAHIGERLHAKHAEKDAERRRARETDEVRLLIETDRIAQDVQQRRGNVTGNRHDQLHQDAVDRNSRRDKLRWMHLEAESRHHAARSIGKDRQGLDPTKDFGRIHAMYAEGQIRQKKRKELVVKQAENAEKAIAERAQQHKELFKLKFKDVESKWGECLDEAPPPRSPKKEHNLGFGSGTPRQQLLGDRRACWSIEAVDHALSTVNSIVALRCNCVPDERQFEMLRDLVDPLQAAMQEYKDAAEESSLHSEGAVFLREQHSQRLFADGKLLEDPTGCHNCCEADKVRQLKDDFDVLLEQASRAQSILLSLIGPGADANGKLPQSDSINRRWPKGAKWNHPNATRKSQFAYNPGAKSRDAAAQKAFVRFGPAEGEQRYWHVTDFARVGLVFVDATLLRTGLEQLIQKFEVLDVRNYYNPVNESLMKQHYVEMIVVLKIPEPFLCEIRLEEYSFFIARQRALPHLEKIGTTLAQLYVGNGAEENAIKYLAKHVLYKPKEPHSLTVFKKHLANKFGSSVAAWRRVLGNGNQVSFNTFRRVCQEVGQRHRCVEFWQLLDCTRSGCISLFEMDPEAVVLLIKFYWRIVGVATQEQLDNPQKLFDRLTSKSVVKLNQPGRLEAHEFRRVAKILGFSHLESDKMFEFLDSAGGSTRKPPVTISPLDLAWLVKLPSIVSIDCIMLKDPRAATELDTLRAMTYSGRVFASEGSRARTPSAIPRGSVASGRASIAGALARRSVSQEPFQGPPRGSVARASMMNASTGSRASLTPRLSVARTTPSTGTPFSEAAASPSPAAPSPSPASPSPAVSSPSPAAAGEVSPTSPLKLSPKQTGSGAASSSGEDAASSPATPREGSRFVEADTTDDGGRSPGAKSADESEAESDVF